MNRGPKVPSDSDLSDSEEISSDRREFLKLSALGVTSAAAASLFHAQKASAKAVILPGKERTILGYCWPWTVRPGENLDFKVSTYGDNATKPYQADLVRIFCGDSLSSPYIFKEIEKDAPFNGQYTGREQGTYPGSYVEIPEAPVLNRLNSFTVQTFVFPTFIPQKAKELSTKSNPTSPFGLVKKGSRKPPEFHDQTLVSRWDERKQSGWSFYLDKAGRLAFKVGSGKGKVHKIHLQNTLIKERWFLVTANYDASNKKITLTAKQTVWSPSKEWNWPSESLTSPIPQGISMPQQGPLRFGATTNGSGNSDKLRPADVLNGKLDSVRLANKVLSAQEIDRLSSLVLPAEMASDVVGFWDFSKGIGTVRVDDLSANQLQGEAVNLPERGVVGIHWDAASVSDWRHKPEHYTACYFHDDDLYDAEWQTDFSYQVAESLPSGIYAARLKHGDFVEHIPFFVAPPKGKPTAKAALLIATATYAAYTNPYPLPFWYRRKDEKQSDGTVKQVLEPTFNYGYITEGEIEFQANHPELGKGTYAYHPDDTSVKHSSQKHPNLFVKLGGSTILTLDTYITALLHQANMDVDIITDDLLHQEGLDLLQDYSVIMTGSHPEYYSKNMQDAVEGYVDQGGRLMYLGGNGFYMVASYHNELDGVIEVRRPYDKQHWMSHEMVQEFDGHSGGEWMHCNRPAHRIVGVGMGAHGNVHSNGAPYHRNPDSNNPRAQFIFDGIKEQLIGDFGLYDGSPTGGKGGAAGYEVDSYSVYRGSPAHTLVVASSGPFDYPFVTFYGMTAEQYQNNYPMPRADMVFFETANGGAVFSVGSIAWSMSLSHNDYQNNVAKITLNVLKRFIDSTPFQLPVSEK